MKPGEIITLYALADRHHNLYTVEMYTTRIKAETAWRALSGQDQVIYPGWVEREFIKAEDGQLYQLGLCVSERNIR